MRDSRSVRSHISSAIQETVSFDDDLPEGTTLKGWVVIAEWVDPQGSQWLSQLNGGPIATDSIPTWQVNGYLHNALFDPVEFVPDDE